MSCILSLSFTYFNLFRKTQPACVSHHLLGSELQKSLKKSPEQYHEEAMGVIWLFQASCPNVSFVMDFILYQAKPSFPCMPWIEEFITGTVMKARRLCVLHFILF